MPRPTVNEMTDSIKRACNTDPQLKETYTSRLLDFSEEKLLVEFKVRGAGKIEKWIPRQKAVK
jgi:hypothetical protein